MKTVTPGWQYKNTWTKGTPVSFLFSKIRKSKHRGTVDAVSVTAWPAQFMQEVWRGWPGGEAHVLLQVKTLFSPVSICSSVKWRCEGRIVRWVKHHGQDGLLQTKCAFCFL